MQWQCAVIALGAIICIGSGCAGTSPAPESVVVSPHAGSQSHTTDVKRIPTAEDVDRAAYWQERGHVFDPNRVTAKQMDDRVRESDPVLYWREKGCEYDPKTRGVTIARSKARLPRNGGVSQEPQPPMQSPQRIVPVDVGPWALLETTTIEGWVKTIRSGTVFRTVSGNAYEVAESVMFAKYELRPEVTVLTNGPFFKLLIEGVEDSLLCRRLAPAKAPIIIGPYVLEARVVRVYDQNGFNGVKPGNIYKLSNGQVWRQTGTYEAFDISLAPMVTIWPVSVEYRMKVEKIEHSFTVERLQ